MPTDTDHKPVVKPKYEKLGSKCNCCINPTTPSHVLGIKNERTEYDKMMFNHFVLGKPLK